MLSRNHLGSSVGKTVVRGAKVPGARSDLYTFHSVGKFSFSLEVQLKHVSNFGFKSNNIIFAYIIHFFIQKILKCALNSFSTIESNGDSREIFPNSNAIKCYKPISMIQMFIVFNFYLIFLVQRIVLIIYFPSKYNNIGTTLVYLHLK